MFNVKCDPIHEFGENHYNEILFNPQGNMVGLCGFGNLRGESLVVECRCGDMGLGGNSLGVGQEVLCRSVEFYFVMK